MGNSWGPGEILSQCSEKLSVMQNLKYFEELIMIL